MENSQEQTQHMIDDQPTDLSKYNLNDLRARQGTPDRRVPHKIVSMSDGLKDYFKKSKAPKTDNELVSKETIRDLFRYYSSNFYGPGKHYVVDHTNKAYVFELLSYFSKSEKFGSQGVVKNEASLDKGLLVFGPCGVGKTDLFEIFRRMGHFLAGYGYMQMYFKGYTAKDVVFNKMEFSKKPNERDPHLKKINIETGSIYLDDVGTEPKFFSQEAIGDWIQQRYIKEKSNPFRNFLTSNSSPSELSERYGMQVEDRLREMYNIIKWEGVSKRGKR